MDPLTSEKIGPVEQEYHDRLAYPVADGKGGYGTRTFDDGEVKPDEASKALHNPEPLLRTFDTGATRDTDDGKLDYEGFLSPVVLEEFAHYMHKNRYQKDGSVRDSDNWQKGIPYDAYMKSMFRHFMEVWIMHRRKDTDLYDAEYQMEHLAAMLFNVMGYMHAMLKDEDIWRESR